MSSFKRKATGKQTLPNYPGTRISPASNLSLITSTGVASLDDILGGGLPLSCSLVFAAPDIHSSYGELVQKYFIAQGLASGHRICVVGQDAGVFVGDVMWLSKSQMSAWNAPESDEHEDQADQSQKVRIAWRYEKMKRFQTTVGNTSQWVLLFQFARLAEDSLQKRGVVLSALRVVKPCAKGGDR
jgi:elongator complex protein 4